MITYLIIFILKIIENTLATLRIILVANGKKKLGALLQGIVTLVWIISASIVIIDINKDIFKIFFFCIGATIGSYFGSIIEEKIALGTICFTCTINIKYENKIIGSLKNYKTACINIKNDNRCIIVIILKRKEANKIKSIIKSIDKNAIIISQKIKNMV